MIKKILTLGLSLGVATSLMAEPNVPRGDFEAKIAKIAGPDGEYLQGKEIFPKDYMLVHKNLPYFVGISLFHPQSSNLELSKEQLNKLNKLKKNTVPNILKISKDIKVLELSLANNIVEKRKDAKSQYEIVDAISKLRTDLTKAHLRCLNSVQDVLNKKQYKKLVKIASTNMYHKKKFMKPAELVPFIHGGKMVKIYGKKLGISDNQMQQFANKIMMGFVPKIEKAMLKVKKLENIVRVGVYEEHKNSKALKSYVDEIAELKKEVTNYRIEAYLVLQDILTKEQFKKGMKILQGKNHD